MYTMKQTCSKVGMNYETLKFYCNEGLVPNIERNENNHRIFTDKNIAWISGLTCLKNCGMSISEMKEYLELCLDGQKSIPKRRKILAGKRKQLLEKKRQIQVNLNYIDDKQKFFNDVENGTAKYFTNLK